ncbi:hypothetical protein HGM15179_008276 [Zosterops borbonicus]|uniref:Uncharacterized protein n=1 Tax=Zosterops borbonicus TaxID=364589 RepID=A0A8K1GI20_9PASS|nr:hypothetical protein HGM15179_008276 [Zosterops borbonicus]
MPEMNGKICENTDCGPGTLTLMVQSSNSCDTMSGGAQLELQLHWQNSVEMDSRDDDGSLQVLEGYNSVTPKPSLFQAEQSQLSQPFLIGEVLHPSNGLDGLLWICANMSMSCVCWGP